MDFNKIILTQTPIDIGLKMFMCQNSLKTIFQLVLTKLKNYNKNKI